MGELYPSKTDKTTTFWAESNPTLLNRKNANRTIDKRKSQSGNKNLQSGAKSQYKGYNKFQIELNCREDLQKHYSKDFKMLNAHIEGLIAGRNQLEAQKEDQSALVRKLNNEINRLIAERNNQSALNKKLYVRIENQSTSIRKSNAQIENHLNSITELEAQKEGTSLNTFKKIRMIKFYLWQKLFFSTISN